MIQKIERIPIRDAFKHEALDFTRWLEQNIDVLNDVLDRTLANAEREQAAGDFSVDLVAEDDSGTKVIIENQLSRSDHDHLGKLITYLAMQEAKTAIWIVSDPRPEHVSAVTWLNESGLADFYLIKLEVIRIGDSSPAPLLTLIVGPSESTKAAGKAKQEFSERYELRHQFWAGLLEYAKSKTKLHVGVSPGRQNWMGTGAGRSGLSLNYVVWEHTAAAELYIDRGKDADEENKAIFDALIAKRAEIEAAFGPGSYELDWQRLDNRRACRIRVEVPIAGYRDEDRYAEVYEPLVDAMVRLDRALKPHIRSAALEA